MRGFWKQLAETLLFLGILGCIYVGVLWHLYDDFVATPTPTKVRVPLKAREQALLRERDNVRILFLGSSHVEKAVDSTMIPGAFNYSRGGEQYIQTYYKVKRLIERGAIKPDLVVLELDWLSFAPYRADRFAPEDEWGQYVDYLAVGVHRRQPYEYFRRYLRATLVPYAGKGQDLLANKIAACCSRERKWLSVDDASVRARMVAGMANWAQASPEERQHSAARHARVHFSGEDPDHPKITHAEQRGAFDDTILYYFDKLVELCRSKGIKAVAVKYPVTAEYRKEVEKIISTDELSRLLEEKVLRKHPELTVFDFQRTWEERPELFSDPDHVGVEGSRLVTQALVRRLQDSGDLPVEHVVGRSGRARH